MNYDEKDLIVYICKKISGVGEKTGAAISVYLERLSNLFDYTDRLDELRKVSGKKVLNHKQIAELGSILKEYFPQKIADTRHMDFSVDQRFCEK